MCGSINVVACDAWHCGHRCKAYSMRGIYFVFGNIQVVSPKGSLQIVCRFWHFVALVKPWLGSE